MLKLASLIGATFMLASCSRISPHCDAPDAKSIVEATDARRVLRQALSDISKVTITGQIVAKQDADGFEARLAAAVDNAVDRHGDAWEASMVSAYSAALSADDLEAACSAINEGDRASFMVQANRAGVELKAKTDPILKTAGTEVLRDLFEGQLER